MRVVARKVSWSECPPEIAPFTKESQTFLTPGREYEVYATALFQGFLAVQVINDIRQPSWEASWLFDVVDRSVPDDWICNMFHAEPRLVVGPNFVAKDEVSYSSMVELEADQVERFWKRVEDRTPQNDE